MVDLEDRQPPEQVGVAVRKSVEAGAKDDVLTDAVGDGAFDEVLDEPAAHRSPPLKGAHTIGSGVGQHAVEDRTALHSREISRHPVIEDVRRWIVPMKRAGHRGHQRRAARTAKAGIHYWA